MRTGIAFLCGAIFGVSFILIRLGWRRTPPLVWALFATSFGVYLADALVR